MLAAMRAALLLLVACMPRGSSRPPALPRPDITLEVTPTNLGAHTPGELPKVTVTLVNNSTRTYRLPRPGPWAVAMPGALHYEYERAKSDGTWEAMSRTFLMPIDRYPGEDPDAMVDLPPGTRLVLDDNRGIPPLTFSDEVVGKMRARLVYDVDAELERRKVKAPHVEQIVSNFVELDQLAGPLEVKLEAIGKIVVGKPVDLPHVLRVTVRNRSDHDVAILGPGPDSGIAFDIYQPNGGVWPKGERPEMGIADTVATPSVLHPGEMLEVYGPNAALGAEPVSRPWTYPLAESFKLRANFYQPTPQRFHYSDWVQVRSVP
jgi:hypothetical protein